MKKQYFIIGFILISNSLVGESTDLCTLEERVCALEQPCCTINPSARLYSCEKVNLLLSGSALYWQASEGGLDFAMRNPTLSDTNQGKHSFKIPHSEWDWGFKLGADYLIAHDGWDLFLQWTRFHPESAQKSAAAIMGITPLLSPNSMLGLADAAKTRWKLRLDLIDLDLGREFFVSRWLTLRPFAGLRSAWILQHLECSYTNTEILPDVFQTIDVGFKNNYWGLGLRAGLNADWGLGCGWSLYSDLAGSILLGRFSLYETQDAWNLTSGALIPGGLASYRDNFRASRFVFDLSLGVRYRNNLCCNRYELMAQLGWEQLLFFNQNQIEKIAASSSGGSISVNNQGDLSAQGVTLTLGFGF